MSARPCPGCGKPMAITHTYSVPGGCTQTAVCAKCDRMYTRVVFAAVIAESSRGAGARALSRKLKAEPDGLKRLLAKVLENERAEAGPDAGTGPVLEG